MTVTSRATWALTPRGRSTRPCHSPAGFYQGAVGGETHSSSRPGSVRSTARGGPGAVLVPAGDAAEAHAVAMFSASYDDPETSRRFRPSPPLPGGDLEARLLAAAGWVARRSTCRSRPIRASLTGKAYDLRRRDIANLAIARAMQQQLENLPGVPAVAPDPASGSAAWCRTAGVRLPPARALDLVPPGEPQLAARSAPARRPIAWH